MKVEKMAGFIKSKKKGIWIFKLKDDYIETDTGLKNYTFDSDWLKITWNEEIVVRKGYTWDGCTPKITKNIGVFDGLIDKETNKKKAYYPSLIHDALYQYYGYHGISRKQIDLLFLRMLQKKKFAFSWLYYIAVRLFGGLFFKDIIKIKLNGRHYEYYRIFYAINNQILPIKSNSVKTPNKNINVRKHA